jgi:adenosylcobinamide hydrolase
MTFETTVREGVLQFLRPDTRWLSSGWDGGYWDAPAAYNVSVPEGWTRTDLDAYLAERRSRAEFDREGPGLLTGVEMQHARGARLGPVVACATVGVSNPAALPMSEDAISEAEGVNDRVDDDANVTHADDAHDAHAEETPDTHAGTVNVLVGTTRSLDDGALANLLGVAVEAKTATLQTLTGFPGTTTDAVIVGSARDGESAAFAGSATEVGGAARACVREAVRASFASRYAATAVPDSVADADHGVVTDERATTFELATSEETTTATDSS